MLGFQFFSFQIFSPSVVLSSSALFCKLSHLGFPGSHLHLLNARVSFIALKPRSSSKSIDQHNHRSHLSSFSFLGNHPLMPSFLQTLEVKYLHFYHLSSSMVSQQGYFNAYSSTPHTKISTNLLPSAGVSASQNLSVISTDFNVKPKYL